MTSSSGGIGSTSARFESHSRPSTIKTLRDDVVYRNKISAFSGVDEYREAIDFGIKGVITHVGKSLFQATFASLVILYVLNQKHLLPRPVGRVVSKLLFWPTLPLNRNVLLRKPWMTEIDDCVVLGGAPLDFLNLPEKISYDYGVRILPLDVLPCCNRQLIANILILLHHSDYCSFQVRAVINMCAEYPGPLKKYKQLGIRQLWLPTVDHFEPSLEHLKDAVEFIAEHKALNKRVYVHCRVGHGRSAAVVFAWMLYNNPSADPRRLNQKLCDLRDVRKTLWRQPNLQRFHSWLLQSESSSKQSIFRNERETQNHSYGSSWLSEDETAQNSDSDVVFDDVSPDE